MFIVGVMVFIVWLVFISFLAANFDGGMVISLWLDMPSALSFVAVTAAVIVATGSYKTFIAAINALFSKKYVISAADKENAVSLFKLLSKTTVYTAIATTFIGLILMLYNLSDPARLGPNLSIALLSILYGTCINLIIIHPAIHILQSRYNTEERRVVSEKQVVDKLLELCHRQGVSPEDIMEAKEIQFK